MAKRHLELNLPTSVVRIVYALCADYSRRVTALRCPATPPNVRENFLRLNAAIDDSLVDIEPGLRSILLNDVSELNGYDSSKSNSFISKNTYYARKRALIFNIAKRLQLVPPT